MKRRFWYISFNALIISLAIFVSREFYYINWKPFVSPIKSHGELPIRSDNRGSGYFGAPRNGNRQHNGIDISAPVGTDVYAARSGWVTVAEWQRGFGKYVELRHRQNLRTVYAHLSQIDVRKGQRVRQGEILGKVGKTGNANYRDVVPHLHFELHKNGLPQDPFVGYLPMSRNIIEPKGPTEESNEDASYGTQ